MMKTEVFVSLHEDGEACNETSKKHVEVLGSLQTAMDSVLGHTEGVTQSVHQNVETTQHSVQELAQVVWPAEQGKLQSKTKGFHTKRINQATEKLAAVEKSFNTDDLMMMQQMMQRI